MDHERVDAGGKRVAEEAEQRGDGLDICAAPLRSDLGRDDIPAGQVRGAGELAVVVDGLAEPERLKLGGPDKRDGRRLCDVLLASALLLRVTHSPVANYWIGGRG